MQNGKSNTGPPSKPVEKNCSAVIERLNKAFDGLWSFRIIERQFRDSEIIVLGELSAAGVIRQQFGKTRIVTDSNTGEASSLGDDLNRAALDALINCAGTLDAEAADVKPSQSADSPAPQEETQPPAETEAATGNGSKKLTNRQLAAIYSLGKARDLSQSEVIALTKERFGRDPMELSRAEASSIIQELSPDKKKE